MDAASAFKLDSCDADPDKALHPGLRAAKDQEVATEAPPTSEGGAEVSESGKSNGPASKKRKTDKP